MISIQPDPSNPDRVIVTQTLTLYLDRVLLETLSSELAEAISAQAAADFRKPAVRKELSRLATQHLAKMLGIEEFQPTPR